MSEIELIVEQLSVSKTIDNISNNNKWYQNPEGGRVDGKILWRMCALLIITIAYTNRLIALAQQYF